MKRFLFLSVFFFFTAILFVSADDKFVLVIDPGHGGRDAGAVRGNYKEKDINLGVALALGRLIESNMKDVKVIYTRKNDRFVDLYKRAEIANKAKANLFVSIHTNSTASRTTTAQGADTYILGLARSEENLAVAKRENSVILLEDNYNKRYEGFDPNSPESYIIFEFMTDKYMEQSLQFANLVQKGFSNIAKRKDRGVRQAGFLVLRESAMPSVLIELGFINNPSEAKYLSTSTGQRSMASSIYTGIKRYIDDFNKRQGQTTSSRSVVAQSEVRENINLPVNNSRREVAPKAVEATQRNVESSPSSAISSVSTTNTETSYVSKNNDVNELTYRAVDDEEQEEDVEEQNEIEESVPIVSRVSRDTEREITVESRPIVKEEKKQQRKNDVLSDVIEYRVQFLISQRKLPANSSQFKGLSPVSEYKDGSTFKYTYGSTASEAEALKIRNEIRNKFKDAFVVQFRNGKRIK